MSKETQRMWKIAGRYSALGIEMAAAVVIGTVGGNYLDERLGTAPWLFWFGVVVGIGAAVQGGIRVARLKKRDGF
jgi:ATP synthase protein I